MEFRIAQISDDPRGVLTGAFVFSPPPHLPAVPRVLVERFGAENTKLGPHGWAVDSKGLRPRVVEKRGAELWLCFGAEISYHVLPNTPVRVSLFETDIDGTEIWPPIPRGKAPPADLPADDEPWPEPAKPEPPKPEPAPAPPPPVPPPAPPPPPPLPVADDNPTVRVPPPMPPPVVQPPAPAKRGMLIGILLAVLLLGAGGGAGWWFWLRPQPQVDIAVVPPVVATPVVPTPPDAPVPGCAEPADLLAGRCGPEQLIALSPAEQTRLAEALLQMGDRRADDFGVRLLSAATSRGHAQAMLVQARLYDPATFRQGGPLNAPNAGRALELYARAAAGGQTDAGPARAALIERLKHEATGTDAAAGRARAALEAAGVQ